MRITTILFFLSISQYLSGQSLLEQLNIENSQNKETELVVATFKSTKLINGQSVETSGKNGFNVVISHRFGNLNSGVHQFFGLDQNSIRLGIEYGVTGRIDLGIGRSKEEELIDGYIKIKLLQQSRGAKNIPVTVSLYTAMAVRADKWLYPELSAEIYNRFSYVNELLIARKFNDRISLQLVPGLIHRNLTMTPKDKNLVPYAGIGGRIKITKHVTFSSEYYLVYPGLTALKSYNPFSFGFEIETGGHVFQLHFSNSRGAHEKLMIPDNNNNWADGSVGFGFNIIRHFNLKKNNPEIN